MKNMNELHTEDKGFLSFDPVVIIRDVLKRWLVIILVALAVATVAVTEEATAVVAASAVADLVASVALAAAVLAAVSAATPMRPVRVKTCTST